MSLSARGFVAPGWTPAGSARRCGATPRAADLVSLCYSGANLVPVAATPAALTAFAERARLQGRRCSSIVGPAAAVGDLWGMLAPYWGAPREVRSAQPVMEIGADPLIAPDPLVRAVRPDEA